MKFSKYLNVLRHLPKTVYFNFHYLPFRQAIKLPILFVSSVKLLDMKGEVSIEGNVRFGMVTFGWKGNPLYQQTGKNCVWANRGGICVFSDKISFCNGLAIEVGETGFLKLGANIYIGPMVRIACYDSITIGANTRIAWESIILDTDFHSTIDINTNTSSAITKPIIIGKNNWIGIRCFVMKGTETPDFCIASAYSLLNKRYPINSYSLVGGIPAKFLKEGLYRDLNSHVRASQKR